MVRPAETASLEGGDILVLSPEVLAVGISERTEEDSIDKFAQTVLENSPTFKKVLAINIPKTRALCIWTRCSPCGRGCVYRTPRAICGIWMCMCWSWARAERCISVRNRGGFLTFCSAIYSWTR